MRGEAKPPTASRLSGLTRRPALSTAILLILGILAHNTLPNAPRLWVGLAASGAILAIAAYRAAVLSTIGLIFPIPLTGVAVAQLEHFHFPANHISGYLTDESTLAEVELILDQPPRIMTPPATGPGRR